MDVLTISPSKDKAILVLPLSYIPRKVKRFTPTATPSSTTIAATKTQSQPQHERMRHKASCSNSSGGSPFTTTTTTTNDFMHYEDPSSFTVLDEHQLLKSPQISRQCVIYALPGFGSTSLMINLIVQIQQENPTRWVSYMDLRDVATFMAHSDETNWTMEALLCSYNKITEISGLEEIARFFVPPTAEDCGENGENSCPVLADLFLDELDDIPPKTQDIFLKMIARDISANKSRMRVWISARSHLKAQIEMMLPRANVYELMPLLRSQQVDFIANYWKINVHPDVTEQVLKNFASGLHDHMEKLVPNFYNTIGACPSHLVEIPQFFDNVVGQLGLNGLPIQMAAVNFSVTKIFEKLVRDKFETYVNKVSSEQPILALSSVQFREKEFRKMERIHVKAVIGSYPTFTCEAKSVLTGNANQRDQAHELYRVGICYDENGMIKFIHKMYAEFIVAQFFVDSGRLKNTSNLYISFFLNHILFDEKCKATRKFFDAYLTVQQQERQKIRGVMVWNRLRCFLVKHYRLNEEACISSSNEEDNVTDEEKVRRPKLGYEDIKMNGSVIHLCIMEGHLKILQMIIDCFKGFPDDLKRLLQITVPLEVFDKNPFRHPDGLPETHVVDAFQMLALFGYSKEFMERYVATWYQLFGEEYMQRYYVDGTCTVLHYAAMNSNHNFLHAVLSSSERKWDRVSVNQRNSRGKQPIHLVLTPCWYYSIKISDHTHPDMKVCPITSGLGGSSTVSTSPNAAVIKEVINAVCSSNKMDASPAPMQPTVLPSKKFQKSPKRKPTLKSSFPFKKKSKVSNPTPMAATSGRSDTEPCKYIWCFEGIAKEFTVEWRLRSENAPSCSPLQSHVETLTELLMNGVDVNAQDEVNGTTVLHQAIGVENVNLIQFLIQHGANENMTDHFQRSPLELAKLLRNIGVIDALATKTNQHQNIVDLMQDVFELPDPTVLKDGAN